jgi:pilus assembly protein FimV
MPNIPNEFGVPEDNDWLIEEDTTRNDALVETAAEVASRAITPEVESQLETEPQSQTMKQGSEDEHSFDDFELPKLDEDDVLAKVVNEPDESQLEQKLSDGAETFEFDAPELPGHGEDEAVADAFADKPTSLTSFSPQGEEQDVLHELFSNPQGFGHADDISDAEDSELASFTQSDESLNTGHSGLNTGPSESNSMPAAVQDERLEDFADFEETALADLLEEDVQDSVNNMFDKPLDATSIDSAGLDIDAMLDVGGEDWKGFNLRPEQQSSIHHDIPDDQQDIWASAERQAEPKIRQENWAQQDNLTESPSHRDSQYMTIDQLMAQVEQEGEEVMNPDDKELKLDVGLNEFPDVIGDIGNFDVDSNAEAADKLDLAKIYIEMSDPQGAIKLLEEAIVDGSDDIRREAKSLIDALNGR